MRMQGWYSPFLMACWNAETEEYQSMCRCMSGFTDEFYQRTFDALQPHLLPSKPAYYSTHESPSVWFAPTLVWEIRGADFTVSPTHTAAFGHVHADRGVSLRFPRFLRARDDKVSGAQP
jgi:DNA ligase-1